MDTATITTAAVAMAPAGITTADWARGGNLGGGGGGELYSSPLGGVTSRPVSSLASVLFDRPVGDAPHDEHTFWEVS